MVTGRYDYSIEIARNIYRQIKNDAEAIEVCVRNIEDYYAKKGIVPEKSIKESDYMIFHSYKGGNQNVTLITASNKPLSINLMLSDDCTYKILEEAFCKKEIFGLPVFMITVMQDYINQANLHLMSKDQYLSLDTPGEQKLRQIMNLLDDVIDKYGGDYEY